MYIRFFLYLCGGNDANNKRDMQILQFLRTKWQAFRAWQENPRTYRMDESEHVCNNCGHTFKGNYCPVCSQAARHGRIGWLSLWEGIGQLWGIESRSGIYTIWQLLWRPGYLVRDYISGKRQVSYPPVKLLFILAAIIAVVQFFFPMPVKEPMASGFRYLDFVSNWLQNHANINALLSGCLFILPTWWLFRNAPRYPKHTIPEGFFLQVYVAILSFLFASIFAESETVAITLSYAYMYIIYKQLFGYGYWGTLWRLVVCAVMSFVALFVLIIIGLTISELRQNNLYTHTNNGATTDIFYVCSTEVDDWVNAQGDTVHFADMSNPTHRTALYNEMHGVATLVCPDNCNFYAPYYNQATIEGLLRDTALCEQRCAQASEEVIPAFDKYMLYKNQGRPFVLMGYSQGGYAVVELLKHLTSEQASRMVAAYVIVYQVTETDLQHPNIRAAQSATDTGVTICYNSVASPDAEIAILSGKTVIGINPVNWRTDPTPATYVYDYDDANDTLTATLDTLSHLTVISGYHGRCPMLPFVGKEGNYHGLEIPLYYRSLKENIALRCLAQ